MARANTTGRRGNAVRRRYATDRRIESEATRARLVKSAADLFLKRGYARVSVRDLAAACGLTTGAIYSRFRNKAELLAAAIEAHMDNEAGMALGRPQPGERPVSRAGAERGALERSMLARLENYPSRSALRALLLEGAAAARRDRNVRASLRAEQVEHVRRWVEIYQGWQRDQGIDPSVDCEAALMLIWAAELGLGVFEAYGIEPPKPRAWRKVGGLLLEALQR